MCLIQLLQNLANEWKDEQRKDSTPDKGVDDHDHPPEQTSGGCAKGIGDNVARLAKKALEEQKQREMQHAQRHVGEQE